MSKRLAQKAATRDKLVVVARGMFSRHGYDTVTIRAIARASDVSTGAVFAHWDGKAALYAEAMGRPAPDPVAFLERVAAKLVGTEHEVLATEALDLRGALIGTG